MCYLWRYCRVIRTLGNIYFFIAVICNSTCPFPFGSPARYAQCTCVTNMCLRISCRLKYAPIITFSPPEKKKLILKHFDLTLSYAYTILLSYTTLIIVRKAIVAMKLEVLTSAITWWPATTSCSKRITFIFWNSRHLITMPWAYTK